MLLNKKRFEILRHPTSGRVEKGKKKNLALATKTGNNEKQLLPLGSQGESDGRTKHLEEVASWRIGSPLAEGLAKEGLFSPLEPAGRAALTQ